MSATRTYTLLTIFLAAIAANHITPSLSTLHKTENPKDIGARSTSAGYVAREKCEYYAANVFRNTSDGVFDKVVDGCNVYEENNTLVSSTNPNSSTTFPHMALVGFGNVKESAQWHCSGSLISPEFVLTAGVCLYRGGITGPARWVLLGDLNLEEDTDDASPLRIAVRDRIAHPDFKRGVNKYNDIGLLRLEEAAALSPHVRPACLSTQDSFGADDVLVRSAWDTTDWQAGGYGALRKTAFRLLSQEQCSNRFYDVSYRPLHDSFPRGVMAESQVCAEGVAGADCVGSGSPVQAVVRADLPHCTHQIVAISSSDINGCSGKQHDVFLFTRVSHYVPWIERIVWPQG